MRHLAPDFPFAPARTPFFYGWLIVVVATVGIILSIPGQTMGVSVFTDHLIAATGLSRLELSFTYLIGTLVSSLLLPRGGVLLDRLGSRVTAMAACAALAVTLAVMSGVDRLSQAVASGLGGVDTFAPAAITLTIGFTFLRFSGQGMLTMSSRTMLTKWFERRRGLASGIAGVFISFGFASAPRVLQVMIDALGWRGAWLGMALAVGGGMLFIAWLFYRDNPEECGLRMDGASRAQGEGDAAQAALGEEPVFTRGEALRTAAFWFVTLALSIHAMIFTGVTFHIVDLGSEAGIGGRAAVALFLPIAAVSTLAGLTSGWAADRVPVRALVLIFTATQMLGFVGASQLGAPLHPAMMVVGWGVGGGIYGTLVGVALPNFFGRTHLGAISSVQMSCMVAGSAGGPALLAAAKTYLGSYQSGLLLSCAFSAAAFAFAAVAPLPRR